MTSRFLRDLMLGGAIVAGASATPAFADTGWSFSTGADYTSGNYGESVDTKILIVPFTASYNAERWSFGITVPYVSLDGSGNVIPGTGADGGVGGSGGSSGLGSAIGGGSGGLLGTGLLGSTPPGSPPPPPPPTPIRIKEQGLGDITLAAGFVPYVGSGGDKLSLNLNVRTPTGDESRALGAGQAIGSVAVGYSVPLGQRADIYGAVGYQRAFDTDADSVTAGAGIEGFISENVLLGLSAEWAQASVDGRPNQTQASLYGAVNMSDHVRLVAYALAGLSDTAPDSGGGLRIVFH